MTWLNGLDRSWLHWISDRFGRGRVRKVMAVLSYPPAMLPALFLATALLLILGMPLTRWRVGEVLVAIILSDQTCNLLKILIRRVRPDGLTDPRGSFWKRVGHYSFPSAHAANNFVVALLIARWLPAWGIPAYIWAFLVSFSRVALHKHYPFDVAAGAMIGTGYGLLMLLVPV